MWTSFLRVMFVTGAVSLAGCAPYAGYSGGYSSGYSYGYFPYSSYDRNYVAERRRLEYERRHYEAERVRIERANQKRAADRQHRDRERDDKRGRENDRRAAAPTSPSPEDLAAAIRKKFD